MFKKEEINQKITSSNIHQKNHLKYIYNPFDPQNTSKQLIIIDSDAKQKFIKKQHPNKNQKCK